jgi:prepilin-type N-terminal cleavage/methylation domain-containing protein
MLKKNNAFTLIELLIVTAILFVISICIYATFNNGIRIWQRLNQGAPEQDLYIFFDRFGSDIRNCLKFKNINFYGRESELSFAALVESDRLPKKTIGSISYFYDAQSGTAFRAEKDFSNIYAGEGGAARKLLSNVKSIKFQYYSYDALRKEYVWQTEWFKEGLPLAVWLEVELSNGYKFSKTVNLPIAG